MFRSNSPFGNDTSSYADSIQSNGYSTMDEASSQESNLSRPSAKSIYMQRKEYAAEIHTRMNKFQYRVEHLFTCELDGKELRIVADCVEWLKLLEEMGRVWGQSMLLEVCGPKLLLKDIETKMELESMALSDIVELKAVLDSGVYNSLLTVSVQSRRKQTTSVFMFQCEDVRADYVQNNLSRALSHRKEDSSIGNVGLLTGHQAATKSSEPKEQKPAVDSVPKWEAPDYEEEEPTRLPFTHEEEPLPPPRPYTELDRNVDILNHVLNDLEIFMGQVAAVVAKNGKKKKKKKQGRVMAGMPPAAEFAACLHKIKCGFNLLVELDGKINNPSTPEFVHTFFSILTFLLSHCPEGLSQTIVAPLLTPQCIRLMNEEASKEEDQLWQSLGDAWNIPSTKWPEDNEDIPTYTLEFLDGWQPPEVSAAPEAREPVSRQESPEPVSRQESPEPVSRQESPEPVSRQESPEPAPSQVNQALTNAERQVIWREEDEHKTSAKRRPAHSQRKARSGKSKPRHMRVVYDFISRNHRELTVRKGEIVELLDMSKQWWKVRGLRGEEGFVPNNVLEACDDQPVQLTGGPPKLTKRSKPAEVKAWLEDKGFGKITVRCLGVLSGSMLLGMTREELKSVSPEEGGRVFFQLQAVKAATTAAS